MTHLREWQRYQIAAKLEAGCTKKEIAEYLHVHPSTITRRFKETDIVGIGVIVRGRDTDSSHPIRCSASQPGWMRGCLCKPRLILLGRRKRTTFYLPLPSNDRYT
ncbi:MAG: helix-turn-helix domain-containing protein [Bacteroidales bacterium]|nr:helix-turn-helix domain-containing protein [Candidatus Cacconaster merdequi]